MRSAKPLWRRISAPSRPRRRKSPPSASAKTAAFCSGIGSAGVTRSGRRSGFRSPSASARKISRIFCAAAKTSTNISSTAPLAENIPVLMALIEIWYRDFWDYAAQAVIPYDQRLARFPAYLQQLEMESNGKSVDLAGEAIETPTGAVIFGEPGTNAQHAFFQLLPSRHGDRAGRFSARRRASSQAIRRNIICSSPIASRKARPCFAAARRPRSKRN